MNKLIHIQEAERALRLFVSSLRWSLDTRLLHRETGNSDNDIKILLAVEEARIRLNRVSRSRHGMQPQDFPKIAADLRLFIRRFMDLDDLDNGSFSGRRFRLGPVARDTELDAPDSFLASFRDEKIFVGDALKRFAYFLDTTEVYLPEVEEENGLIELEKITPKQQLSPVQFKINAGKLHVQRVAQEIPVPDQQNVASALDSLLVTGDDLLSELKKSNCDPRITRALSSLHESLREKSNIVKIGLENIGLSVLVSQCESELSLGQLGMLQAYSAQLSRFAAQFPDWARFSEQAAAVELDVDDVERLDATIAEVGRELENRRDISDEEVPKTIKFVRKFTNGGMTGKRAAFALMRTIENLVSTICHYCLTFLKKTSEKILDIGSGMAAKAIVGLLALALTGALGIAPLAQRAGVPWLAQAAQIIRGQLQQISK